MESDRAALRISALISISTITVCLTCRSQSKMPMIASVLSACMKILSIESSKPLLQLRLSPAIPEFPIRPHVEGAAALVHATGHSQTSRQRDHCSIVRAELNAREIQFRPDATHHLGQPLAQAKIGADASRDDQAPMPGRLERTAAFLGESFDHSFLKA